ncbi:MAG: hypothetical protein ACKOQ3_01920 [Novosphingobium sp.]
MNSRLGGSGGLVIVDARNTGELADGAILSFVFAAGQRPDAAAIATAGSANTGADIGAHPAVGGFTISLRPDPAEGWLELLSSGLTFDCAGLTPAEGTPLAPRGALLGLDAAPGGEAVSLRPGNHIAEGKGMLPVVRIMAAVGLRFAALPDVRAVCWQPAGSWMEPGYYRRVVGDWLGGGAFPSLGLTSLRRESNGAMVSLGLGLLIGQELRFEPERNISAGAVARISVRLIHELIASGPLSEPREFAGIDGETLLAVPVRGGEQLRVMVRK